MNAINVTDQPFNAKGDGITDDTRAIQSALKAAACEGKDIYFPEGTYYVGEQISVPDGVYFAGAKISGKQDR